MTVDEIIAFCCQWTPPTNVWTEPSRGGLETALTAGRRSRAGRFAADAILFADVGPAYSTALLLGWRTQSKDPSWTFGPPCSTSAA